MLQLLSLIPLRLHSIWFTFTLSVICIQTLFKDSSALNQPCHLIVFSYKKYIFGCIWQNFIPADMKPHAVNLRSGGTRGVAVQYFTTTMCYDFTCEAGRAHFS